MDRPTRFLVLSKNPQPAEDDGCGEISKALGGLPRDRNVEVRTLPLDRWRSASGVPAVVAIHTDRAEGLFRTVVQLKRRWEGVATLAVLCEAPATPSSLLDALDAGLDDYLICPFNLADFVPRVERLLRMHGAHARTERKRLKPAFSLKNIVGESEPFLRVVEMIPRVAALDATVLITGETGTGKELFARAVHYTGPRRRKPFAPVNCGALPDHLVENELFGHEKGAYTDASSAAKGVVAEAEGGTVFLDEVEALSPYAQSKLLRFLQDREYRPLGSPRCRTADVRVVAATNLDLLREVESGRFRRDLFYRLSILGIDVPPLRERPGDIAVLADHFLGRFARQQGKAVPRLSVGGLEVLLAQEWLGNVRELEAVIQRSILLSDGTVLEGADIDVPYVLRGATASEGFQEAKSHVINRFEHDYVTRVLAANRGNISQAARSAGTDRRALQRLMRKHRIDRQGFCV